MAKKIFFLTIFLGVLFSISTDSFGSNQDDKLSKALELFDNKKYADAEPLFKTLIEEKPESLELYYYYGACRTENQNYSEYDLIQLLNADPAEAPLKINYYLGIQYQAQENWEQALKNFNKFRMDANSEELEALDVASKIQQCYNQENPYKELLKNVTESSLAQSYADGTETDTSTAAIEPSVLPDSANTVFTEENEKVADVPAGPDGTPVEFIVNSRITYYNTSHFQTEEGRAFFNESNQNQQRLDSILTRTDELREQYLQANSAVLKDALGKKIVTLETESYPLHQEITNLLLQAQNKELEYWNKASEDEIETFFEKVENEKEYRETETTEAPEKNMEPDTSFINPEIFLSEENNDILLEEPEQKDELIYRIQIGAYSRGLPTYVERLFKKLAVLRKIDNYTDDRGVVVYTTGKLTNLEDAVKMQKQVRQEGVEDAFVVPYFNGKRITLEEAKKIESEL
ncbi:hypothetical protein GM418_22670 [Maribellus comscasis]|uniref:Tetratricopeptide repeat protein n=1 Tax=Maribellus comscasis TaxID=2681766 RepID=A0A6I6K1Q1_9BACT|nr:hypothetical protein [Maribellus comscasis]QGY46362.1 hypothetical protein GM418_22670 [Maribellus comscasis]